jgi:hypothetical protein
MQCIKVRQAAFDLDIKTRKPNRLRPMGGCRAQNTRRAGCLT